MFQAAGWTIQHEPGGDSTLFFDCTPVFGGNAFYSRGHGHNQMQTKIEISGPVQTLFPATGST